MTATQDNHQVTNGSEGSALGALQQLQRVPRLAWLILAGGLYVLLYVLGAVQVVVDGLPGRDLCSKIYHVIFYGGFAGMVWLSMSRPSARTAVLLTACAGALDELQQTFFSFRHAQVSDVVLDTVAGAVAVGVLVYAKRRRERSLASEAEVAA